MRYERKKESLQSDGEMAKSLRKADRRKAGRAIAITAYMLALAIMAAGCGKAEEPIRVDLSAGKLEELQGETDGDADAGSDAGGNAEDSLTDQADAGTENDTENGTAWKDGGDSENQAETGTENDDATAQDAQAGETIQLEGDVRSVNKDSFVICKHETWEEDGYSYAVAVAPGYEEESDLITIHTAQNCVYQYKTVKNSGIDPEDVSTRDGSFADVKEGLSVTVKGSWQEDGSFLADSVVLMEIV